MKRLILILLVGMCGTVSGALRQRVSGRVEGSAGEPLAGAAVTVEGYPSLGTVADASGRYELSLPDSGVFRLRASFVGYDDAFAESDGSPHCRLNFRLVQRSTMVDQVVVTATRTPKLLKDVPIVTRVITGEEIRRADANHIGDLLQTELPGIEFSYSMNQQVSLNMSGFGGNSVLFLVDGERLAGETLDNVDYSRLNMDNVERIEIVKGAVSSLYGSNAIGGVVNVISREPTEPWRVNANARYGAHDEQRYGGTVGFHAGRVGSTTSVQYLTVGDIDLAKGADGGTAGDYSRIYGGRTFNVKERLVVTPAEGLRITARAGYFFRERNASQTIKDRYRSFSGGAKGNYRIAPSDDLELSYVFDQYDKSDYLVPGDRDVRDYSNVQHTLRTLYNHTFAGRHILTVGGDYMRDYLMSYQFENNGNHTQHTADAFAQFDWNPHRKFNLVAGLRFDYFSETELAHLSPKIGVMYKVANCSLRGSYAGGFRAPTLKEMYMNFYMGNIFMIYGNPDLKPETSHNFSLSAEYMKGAHSFTLMGFYNTVDHSITTVWNRELAGQVYTNISALQVAGAEVNATGRYRCGISWRLSYAYTHEHIGRGEPMVATTRPHTATARVAYDRNWEHYGLSVALSGRYLSKLTADEYIGKEPSEGTVSQTYPGYTIWKLSLTQRLWRGIDLTLAVDNLFDYRPEYYYNNSPGTTGTTCSVGLSLDFERMFKKREQHFR